MGCPQAICDPPVGSTHSWRGGASLCVQGRLRYGNAEQFYVTLNPNGDGGARHLENIPQQLARTVRASFAEEGEMWLRKLPRLLASCAQKWSLSLQSPFPALSYHYVCPVQRADGAALVLKVGVPNRELFTEMEALRLFEGRGSVQLVDADRELGALLLERLRPGEMLTTIEEDEKATTIAAQVMQQLWRPLPDVHSFPTVAKWAQGLQRLRARFDGGTGPFPRDLVEEAEGLFHDLLASAASPVLLHGDLHHYNILSAQRSPWLVIDPKGLAGEPAYEAGALLRNPMPQIVTWPDLGRLLTRRVHILAGLLDADRQRIHGWGMAQAVLAAWWTYEEGGQHWKRWLVIARELSDG